MEKHVQILVCHAVGIYTLIDIEAVNNWLAYRPLRGDKLKNEFAPLLSKVLNAEECDATEAQ